MHGLNDQRAKFEDFKLDVWNAHHKLLETQSKAHDARTEPDTSSTKPAEWNAVIDAYEAGVSNADREAREANEKHAAKCREFRDWCSRKRDEIPRMLDDPAQVFESTDERAGWQKLHDDIVEHLPSLEGECPRGDDPKPPPPGPKAIRTLG